MNANSIIPFMCLCLSLPLYSQTVVYDGPARNGVGGHETETRRKDPAQIQHDKDISNDAQSAATQTLAFVFYTLPEIQRLHNERLNSIEGQFTPIYRSLDSLISTAVPVTVAAATMPTIEGHVLGETWTQFLANSTFLNGNVIRCRATKPKAQSNKKQVYDPCIDVLRVDRNSPNAITISCLMSAVEIKDMMCRDFDGEITFAAGKLIGIKLVIEDVDWKGTTAEMVRKFGAESGISDDASTHIWKTYAYALVLDHVSNECVSVYWAQPSELARVTAHQAAIHQEGTI